MSRLDGFPTTFKSLSHDEVEVSLPASKDLATNPRNQRASAENEVFISPRSPARRPDRSWEFVAPKSAAQEMPHAVPPDTSMQPRKSYPSDDSHAHVRSSLAATW